MRTRFQLLLVALTVALAVSVGGAVAATAPDADYTDATSALSALSQAQVALSEATSAVQSAKVSVGRIRDRHTPAAEEPTPNEPPAEEPAPIPTGFEFAGTKESDFPEKLRRAGAITSGTMGGKPCLIFSVRNTDTEVTENPRAQLGSPSIIKNGWEGWVRTEVYVPAGINWSGWMTLFSIYGPPYGGSGPVHIEASYGPILQWGRSRTYGEDVPWRHALPRNEWFSLMWHLKMGSASSGWAELYFNGVQQTLTPRSGGTFTRLNMATYDGSINGGGPNNARIAQYRQRNTISGEFSIGFTGEWVGPTRASVGG